MGVLPQEAGDDERHDEMRHVDDERGVVPHVRGARRVQRVLQRDGRHRAAEEPLVDADLRERRAASARSRPSLATCRRASAARRTATSRRPLASNASRTPTMHRTPSTRIPRPRRSAHANRGTRPAPRTRSRRSPTGATIGSARATIGEGRLDIGGRARGYLGPRSGAMSSAAPSGGTAQARKIYVGPASARPRRAARQSYNRLPTTKATIASAQPSRTSDA